MYDVVVSSLEEDLKAIGLLDKDLVLNDEPKDEKEDIEEGRIKRRLVGGKVQTTKKTPLATLRAARRYRRSGKGKAAMRKRARAMAKPGAQRRAARLRARAVAKGTRAEEGLDYVSTLLEEIRDLVKGESEEVQPENVENTLTEMLEAFGLIQEIAALLSEAFAFFGEEDQDDELSDLGNACVDLANVVGTIVDSIETGEVEDLDELEEAFRAHFAVMLEACEVYEAIVEEDDTSGEDDSGTDD